MRNPLLAGAATIAALAATAVLPAASALADSPPDPTVATIGGSPLSVAVGSQGQLQARLAGDTANIFYAPQSSLGDAGFFLAFPAVTGAPAQLPVLAGKVFGFQGSAGPGLDNEYWPESQSAVTGDGSAGNPLTQVSTYGVKAAQADDDTNTTAATPDSATVTQTTTYVSGAQTFTVKWDVKNASAQALRFKAIAAADFYFEGSDRGTGIFTQGPPRFLGGTNADTGRSGGFVEIPAPAPLLPWSAYQALAFADPNGAGNDVWTRLAGAADSTNPSYDDSVVSQPVDNAGAVEWDQYLDPTKTLAPGATASFSLMVRTALPAALQFDQTNAGAPQGVPITFHVTAKDTAGNAFTGKNLISSISGPNAPGNQTAAIGADGTATVTDPGTIAGNDTITSFIDLNGNGVRDANEPQGSALATFVDHTPPSCKVGVTGDRAGVGGAGKPLVITVNCDSPATIATASTLTVTPPTPTVTKKKAHKATADAAKAKKKSKKKKAKKPKKPKPVVVKLKPTSTTVNPGQALPVDVAIPASIITKYPGATAKATVVITATDAAGNVATQTATKTVKIAKPKPKKKPKHKAKKKSSKKKK